MAEARVLSAKAAPPVRFGIIVFLASETLFFGGLFATYFTLRAQTAAWPPSGVRLSVGIMAIATVILLLSSFTFVAGMRAAADGRRTSFGRWVGVTMALGLVFLGFEAWDWTRVDFEISTDAYGTMYFSLTGFHGLHVVAGILLMLVVLGRMRQGAYRTGNVDGPEAVGYYWHFVDVVWIGLFATIFLLQ